MRADTRDEMLDEITIKQPDGKYRESFFIAPKDIILSANPIAAVFTRLVSHANQIGLMGTRDPGVAG